MIPVFEVTPLRQPPNTNQCGQTSLAMFANISIAEACELMGTRGCTYTSHFKAALTKLGQRTTERRLRFRTFVELPTRVFLFAHHAEYRHWMYWANGRVYDPTGLKSVDILRGRTGLRVTSYLPVLLPLDVTEDS